MNRKMSLFKLKDGVKLEHVDKLCSLGNTIGANGSASDAAKTGVKSAWRKFKELLPVLGGKMSHVV
jgi:hypothetical protein